MLTSDQNAYQPALQEFEQWLPQLKYATCNQVALIDDLPPLSHTETRHKFQRMMDAFVTSPSQCKLVVMLTDTPRHSHAREFIASVDNVFSRQFLAKSLTVQLNVVIKATMRRVLNQIMQKECGHQDAQLIDMLIQECQGNLLMAINQLQFHTLMAESAHPKLELSKMSSLTTWHTVGKLLHCKRSEHGELEYSLDDLLQTLNVGEHQLVMYLHENVLAFAALDASDHVLAAMSLYQSVETFNESLRAAMLRWLLGSVVYRLAPAQNHHTKSGFHPLQNTRIYRTES